MRSAGSEQGCGKLLVEPEGDRSLKKIAALPGEGLSVSAYAEEIPEEKGNTERIAYRRN